ncbi:hypothetical protein DHD08_08970 [Arenibacter sp. H213]|nr:hypothetical protein [Arenibacter sp. H213]
MFLRGSEVVGENWNGKTSRVDRRSESAWGGLQWKVCSTSARAWDFIEGMVFPDEQVNPPIFNI